MSKRLTPSSTSLQSSRLSNCWHLAAPSFPRPLPPGQPEQRAISSLFYPFSPRSRYHPHLKISILFTPSRPRNRYLIKRIIHFPYTLANIPQLTSLLLNPGKPIRMEGLAPFHITCSRLGSRSGWVPAPIRLPALTDEPKPTLPKTPPRFLGIVRSRYDPIRGHTHTFFPIKAKQPRALAKSLKRSDI